MKLRNLTPFLMLDHFNVGQDAVSSVRFEFKSPQTESCVGVPRSPTPRPSDCYVYAERVIPA